MASKGTNYKNSEVKTRINERLDSIVIESGKLSQAINKSSKSREVCYLIQVMYFKVILNKNTTGSVFMIQLAS